MFLLVPSILLQNIKDYEGLFHSMDSERQNPEFVTSFVGILNIHNSEKWKTFDCTSDGSNNRNRG